MFRRRHSERGVPDRRGVLIQFPSKHWTHWDYNGYTMHPETARSPERIGRFRLGRWEVRPDRNELASEHDTRRLEPRAMDLLVHLAASAPEVVTKAAIIDAVWEGRIISEGTLSNTVAELRRALDDDARAPRYIETIPKRGYRLAAQVEPLLQLTTGHHQPGQRRRPTVLGAATAAAVLAAVVTVTVILIGRNPPLDPRLVLVEPFANRTGDRALDDAAVLARDRLVTSLSESGLVRAVPGAVAEADEHLESLCSAAGAAGAGLAVRGTLYLNEGRVEVQAKLVDVQSSAVLYPVPSAVAARDQISEALDQMVRRTVGGVAVHVHAHAHFQLMSHVPVVESYREFITGSELFASDPLAAVDHLERAVQLDPAFTSAAFRLSTAYRNLGRSAESTAILARLEERRPELTEFERLWLDYFLANQSFRRREALLLLRRVERIVPDDPVVQHLICGSETRLNRPRHAIAAASRVIDREDLGSFGHNPVFVASFVLCSLAHHILGEHEQERRVAGAGLELFPTDLELLTTEAKGTLLSGDRAGFEEVVARTLRTPVGLTPAELLTESAASARAHGHPELGRELAHRALAVLAARPEPSDGFAAGWVRARALVLTDDLDEASTVLNELVSATTRGTTFEHLGVRGWLGVVAARRGKLDTARELYIKLETMDQKGGWPAHYRAGIAAWLGHREQALDLLDQSQAAGWGSFHYLHDSHRALFEPLEGLNRYEALLHPPD